MTLLRRPAPRFVLWAALLVAIAAAAALAGLPAWMIAIVEFAAWVLVAVCERSLSGPWTSSAVHAATSELPATAEIVVPPPPDEQARVEAPPAQREPEAPPPRVEPPALPASTQPGPARNASAASMRWNVFRLEQLVQEQAPANDELAFLIVYLRDFADTDGLLPVGFDSLVRESFGPLLPATQ